MCIGQRIIVVVEEQGANLMSQFIRFYFASYMPNMFRILCLWGRASS